MGRALAEPIMLPRRRSVMGFASLYPSYECAFRRVRDTRESTTALHLITIHQLRRHRLPRARGELPPPGHDHHGCRGDEQHPGADEPAEIAECEEEGALAAVEMAAGGFEQARGT